jgi:uncharacterized protein YodC (DUF2158 family)
MQVGQVVNLKSGGPTLKVIWEIGVNSTPPGFPSSNINEVLYYRSGYDNGDNLCEWIFKNKTEQKVLPVEALSLVPVNLIPSTDQTLTMGCVVKVNEQNELMTVNWVVGANCRPIKLIDHDKALGLTGFQPGDVSCIWFDNTGKLNERPFQAATLTKMFA